MQKYKIITENQLLSVNGMLRKFAKSCILKNELLVSIRTPEKPNEPFSRKIPKLPENFRDWMICKIGDVVQMYGGNRVVIIRGKVLMELRRATFRFAEYSFNSDHIFISAIKSRRHNDPPPLPTLKIGSGFYGDYERCVHKSSLTDAAEELLMNVNSDDDTISTIPHTMAKSRETMVIDTI